MGRMTRNSSIFTTQYFRKNMKSIFSALMPTETDFWPLFSQHADLLLIASKETQSILRQSDLQFTAKAYPNVAKAYKDSNALSHHITLSVHQTFITPIDRSDIIDLNNLFYKTLKTINSAAKKIQNYKVEQFSADYHQLGDCLHQSCVNIKSCIEELQKDIHSEKLVEHILAINQLEKDADDCYGRITSSIFTNIQDDILIIKHHEISAALELATDYCQDLGDTMQNIIVTFG